MGDIAKPVGSEKVTLAIMESEASFVENIGNSLVAHTSRLDNVALMRQAEKIGEHAAALGRMIRQKRIDMARLEQNLCVPAGVPHDWETFIDGKDRCRRCGKEKV